MLLSLPANPVPTDLYTVLATTRRSWLPWYIWGGGVFSTKYEYNTSKHIGYMGTVSVPFVGDARVKSLRVTGSVSGKTSSTEGAMVIAKLSVREGNTSWSLASIMVDRRAVLASTLGSIYIDVTQSAGDFAVSASKHQLAIELIGEGQGIATITGFVVNLEY
jgi:hypothetical protein